jgi:hypothetical protein
MCNQCSHSHPPRPPPSGLTFLEFLEALGRAADMFGAPPVEELREVRVGVN